MSKWKVVLNRRVVKEDILKSHEVKEILESQAKQIKDRCGDGYGYDVKYTKNRLVASVYAETPAANRDNLNNNTLLKASRV